MPGSNEVKQRKKSKQNGETKDTPKADKEDPKIDAVSESKPASIGTATSSSFDLQAVLCTLSLCACVALAWLVLQQSGRVAEVEEKYRLLRGKTAGLLELEEKMIKVSKKLDASEDGLREALSSVALVTQLERDLASMVAMVKGVEEEQSAASRDLHGVSDRFLNVTEAWQSSLAVATEELAGVRAESRAAHGNVTGRVNAAENRLHALAERLEETEDGWRRNGRALERTEEEDARRTRDLLESNERAAARMQEQLRLLALRDEELRGRLEEVQLRARRSEEHLPVLQEALRSALRLRAQLSGVERRLEEVSLQVLAAEESMLTALTDILWLQRALHTLDDRRTHAVTTETGEELGEELTREGGGLDVGMEEQGIHDHHAVIMEMIKELQGQGPGLDAEDAGMEEAVVEEVEEAEEVELVNSSAPHEECEGVHALLADVTERGSLERPRVEGLEQQAAELTAWASSLTEKRQQLHAGMAELSRAVSRIEDRTSAIAADFTAKVGGVRTDVRRMAGLEAEAEALVGQVAELEEKAEQAERQMVRRIGDLLAGSIDRMSALKSSAEQNSQALEQAKRKMGSLSTADQELSDRLHTLESGRARLMKTVSFAGDLLPKVSTIRREFAALDPQVGDLTLRIGRLAEDLMNRQEEIAQMKQLLANLTHGRGDPAEVKEPDLAADLRDGLPQDVGEETQGRNGLAAA